ncbi:LPS-assembly protein LptD [Rhizobacter sp. LjRoot28]|uniref:LPS-assembly protein LptD n=1 Tax=Rhizobacter sp. LjRoot28 TaxID=3342309 RepID=UPI003ECC6A9A
MPSSAASAPDATEPPITIDADDIQGRPDEAVTATGRVDLRQGTLRVEADRLSYDARTDTARGAGNVRLSSDGNWFSGPEVQLAVQRFEGFFLAPSYHIARTNAGGNASRWDFIDRDHATAHDATYTSCPRDGSNDPAWLLSADRVQLDFENNEGRAEGAVLRFYGVPILAAPAFTFPLSDDRKSGWLPPAPTVDSKGGFQIGVPYYWNIAPNRDMTLTPVVSAKRGAGLETEFRYLQPTYDGVLKVHTLPNDTLANRSRGAVRLMHDGALPGDTLYRIDALRVSDDDYWKDFSHNVSSITPRLLDADMKVWRHFDTWTPYARVKRWQVLQQLDPASSFIEAPYDRLPQVGVRMMQPLIGGIQLGMETEFNRFVNPHGYTPEPQSTARRPTGSRTHVLGTLSRPIQTPGWSLVPKLALNAASYSLDAPLTSGPFQNRTDVTRVIPTISIDSAWTLERDADWFGRSVRQTLEPRMLYVKTPYREQAGLPNFDSAVRDFNVESIYTDNAFSGVDRVSDSHQLTSGVTTRVLDPSTGAEQVRLGIAQRFLFQDQKVTPNDGAPLTQSFSDVLLFGSSNISRRWFLDAALQYNPELGRTVRSVVGARYTAPDYRTVAVAHRFKDGESEQVDVSWQWPLYSREKGDRSAGGDCRGGWYAAGRVNYSVLESRVTDAVAAFEYDSGCWIGRIMARRQSTSTRDATTQLGFEIEFIGLSRLGTNNPIQVLKDNVPGYRPLRDDTGAPAETRITP